MTRLTVAALLHYVIALAIIGFSLMWLLSPRVLPFQLTFIDMTQADLRPNVVALLLLLYKSIGANYLLIGLTVAVLTKGPFSRGDAWTRKLLPALIVCFAVPFMIIALRLGSPTFVAPVAMILLASAAFVLSKAPDDGRH